MKRIISLLLACMLTALCACSNYSDSVERTPVPDVDMTVSYKFDPLSLSADSGESYYTQNIATAAVSTKDERAAQRINTALAQLYVTFKTDSEFTKKVAADQTEGSIIELNYYVSAEAPRCDAHALSLIFDVSQDMGGVHAEYARLSRSFDSDSGNLLTLDSIADNAAQLRTYIKNYVISIAAGEEYTEDGESVLFDDYESTLAAIVDEGRNWYFTDTGLVIYANPYDIAPYSLGVLCFEIPYSALTEFIDEDYMPVTYEGENGIVLGDDGTKINRDDISLLGAVTIDEEGQSVVLSAEETVYNVRVFNESSTLWQRNYLTTGEGVEVISYIPDVIPLIYVSYQLADGTEVTRGIFQSGKDGSIILVEPMAELYE